MSPTDRGIRAALALIFVAFAGGTGEGRVLSQQMAQTSSSRVASANPRATGVDWDTAFVDRSGGTPLHFTATYLDGRGTAHRLEEWREGQDHLRRRTDRHIDLHADRAGRNVAGQPAEYTWQILDLDRHIAHRVSTAGMLHLGMLYSYYSMAHVLVRPAGRFTLSTASAPNSAEIAAGVQSLPSTPLKTPCTWWQLDAAGQPSTRLCWSPQYGVPLQMWTAYASGWLRTFEIDSVATLPIPRKLFVADLTGFQVRDVDEIEDSD